MKQNFFERNKKKSALAVFWLFLKGRGKYFAILLLALFASAPLVVTSDAFKAFTNHPAVAAVIRSLGLGGYQFNDTDMVAQAAHNREGKKSSYWQNYFKKINAPLPTGKFTTLKYLNGDISDLGPVKIADRTRNKYGIKGVVNQSNSDEQQEANAAGGVDLSQLMAGAALNGGEDYDENGEGSVGSDSSSMEMELGVNSAFGPFMGQKTILARGGSINKADSLADKVKSDFAARVPRVNGNIRQGKSTGRVSSFAWNRKARGQRAGAFNGARSGKSTNAKMVAAFAYSKNAMETDNVAIADTLAGAVFDGNAVEGSVLDTGEPIKMPNGAYAEYLHNATDAMNKSQACGKAMTNAHEEITPLMEENSRIFNKRFDDSGKPRSQPKCCQKGKIRDWNNDMEKMKQNCIAISNKLNTANNGSCEGSYSVSSKKECNQYDSYKLKTCSWLKCFLAILLGFLTLGLLGGLVIILIAVAIPKVKDWLDKNVGGLIRSITGTDTKFEGTAQDHTSGKD